MPQFSELLLFYIVLISVFAVIITIVDKKRSKKKRTKRIPELTLMIIGLLGGALPMYITMKVIRHKTRHKKFMIGLPLETVLHVVLFLWYIF